MSSKLNLLNSIQIYKDPSPTNNPLQSTANWTTTIQGIEVDEPESKNLRVASKQTEVLFSGVVATQDDNTTTYDVTKKSGVSNTYILKHNSGTAPEFRVARVLSTDATTQFSVTKSGSLVTFTHSGGTAPDFSALQYLDEVRLGNAFSVYNQGKYKVLNSTSNSFTVENIVGVGETVVLGPTYEEQLSIYSSSGVQIGDKVKLGVGFASYNQDVYEITDVAADYLEFNTSKGLPEETDVLGTIVVYKSSKSFLYVEYDKNSTLIIDGVEIKNLKPITVGTKKSPGIYLRMGDMYSAEIKNESSELMSVLVISAE